MLPINEELEGAGGLFFSSAECFYPRKTAGRFIRAGDRPEKLAEALSVFFFHSFKCNFTRRSHFDGLFHRARDAAKCQKTQKNPTRSNICSVGDSLYIHAFIRLRRTTLPRRWR